MSKDIFQYMDEQHHKLKEEVKANLRAILLEQRGEKIEYHTESIPGQKWPFKAIDELCDEAAKVIEELQAENLKLRNTLEICRRYAVVGYSECGSCRIISSEIQKEFPKHD